MADTFGLKIGLEGEKQFKQQLREIDQTFKVLGSEMKLVDEQFDKNDRSAAALAAAASAALSPSAAWARMASRVFSSIEKFSCAEKRTARRIPLQDSIAGLCAVSVSVGSA